jgi:hypothetical protein
MALLDGSAGAGAATEPLSTRRPPLELAPKKRTGAQPQPAVAVVSTSPQGLRSAARRRRAHHLVLDNDGKPR